ncbi:MULTISPECIES: LCP family protein [Staphylococcus]|jgi:LCP family protein required for cell wall assembly|uniref:LCP family protein n=1 Tax=Staphylococcus nepalensis TaxID=214473 RepID=A0A380GP54_9STAP|nr:MULTISPECIES: LCP family protein [Staphylococcus]VDG68128.1 cell envelope-like transcriptional attenuator [Lacrimispora indolis]MBO1214555.1 LCP family protein [Staphylococcus nepalensis]MBO1216588.1 LCP family protein [Staphylococcus nepalensis]MBO1221729.1 LCP family protein [Staphylococcus nepalensis]MBO1227668.1 LCP family protein [Staphylococcus nepalensis]
MKLTRKGKVLIIILVLVLIVLGYFTYKLIHLNQSIHDPQNTGKESKATQEKIKAKKPISIAIFGVDSDVEREADNMGQRTDTLLIASINPEKKETKLISIPRDMSSDIPGVEGNEKIAHAYAYGGPKVAMDTIRQNLDVPIDSYVTVDMDGFKKMIDIFDGVNVTSNATFNYNGSSFKEGKKENLSGDSALNYVRSRKEEGAGGDEGRTARQRQVIDALAQSARESSSIFKLNKILKVSEKNVKTNLNVADLKSLYSGYKEAVQSMDKMSIDGENLIESDGVWYFEPDQADMTDKVNEYKSNLK